MSEPSTPHSRLPQHCAVCGTDWPDHYHGVCRSCGAGLPCRADTTDTVAPDPPCMGSRFRQRRTTESDPDHGVRYRLDQWNERPGTGPGPFGEGSIVIDEKWSEADRTERAAMSAITDHLRQWHPPHCAGRDACDCGHEEAAAEIEALREEVRKLQRWIHAAINDSDPEADCEWLCEMVCAGPCQGLPVGPWSDLANQEPRP